MGDRIDLPSGKQFARWFTRNVEIIPKKTFRMIKFNPKLIWNRAGAFDMLMIITPNPAGPQG
jgi:hypothetical protein